MRNLGLILPFVALLSLYPQTVLGQSVELRAAHDQLSSLYKLGRYEAALPFAEETVRLSEQEFGPEHPTTATLIANLAELQKRLGAYAEAEELLVRALAIRQSALEPDDPFLAESNDSLGVVLNALGRHAEAETYHWEAVRVAEQTLSRRPHVISKLARRTALYRARALFNRALVFAAEQRYAEAEPLFSGAVAVFEANLGPDHEDNIAPLQHHARVLRALGRDEEAVTLESRAAALLDGE